MRGGVDARANLNVMGDDVGGTGLLEVEVFVIGFDM